MRLIVANGPHQGHVYALVTDAPMLIGRNSRSIGLDDTRASRKHAAIAFRQGRWIIKDLHSSNGTFVNNKKIHAAALQEGDRIQIGRTVLIFTLKSSVKVRAAHDQTLPSTRRPPPGTIRMPTLATGSAAAASGAAAESKPAADAGESQSDHVLSGLSDLADQDSPAEPLPADQAADVLQGSDVRRSLAQAHLREEDDDSPVSLPVESAAAAPDKAGGEDRSADDLALDVLLEGEPDDPEEDDESDQSAPKPVQARDRAAEKRHEAGVVQAEPPPADDDDEDEDDEAEVAAPDDEALLSAMGDGDEDRPQKLSLPMAIDLSALPPAAAEPTSEDAGQVEQVDGESDDQAEQAAQPPPAAPAPSLPPSKSDPPGRLIASDPIDQLIAMERDLDAPAEDAPSRGQPEPSRDKPRATASQQADALQGQSDDPAGDAWEQVDAQPESDPQPVAVLEAPAPEARQQAEEPVADDAPVFVFAAVGAADADDAPCHDVTTDHSAADEVSGTIELDAPWPAPLFTWHDGPPPHPQEQAADCSDALAEHDPDAAAHDEDPQAWHHDADPADREEPHPMAALADDEHQPAAVAVDDHHDSDEPGSHGQQDQLPHAAAHEDEPDQAATDQAVALEHDAGAWVEDRADHGWHAPADDGPDQPLAISDSAAEQDWEETDAALADDDDDEPDDEDPLLQAHAADAPPAAGVLLAEPDASLDPREPVVDATPGAMQAGEEILPLCVDESRPDSQVRDWLLLDDEPEDTEAKRAREKADTDLRDALNVAMARQTVEPTPQESPPPVAQVPQAAAPAPAPPQEPVEPDEAEPAADSAVSQADSASPPPTVIIPLREHKVGPSPTEMMLGVGLLIAIVLAAWNLVAYQQTQRLLRQRMQQPVEAAAPQESEPPETAAPVLATTPPPPAEPKPDEFPQKVAPVLEAMRAAMARDTATPPTAPAAETVHASPALLNALQTHIGDDGAQTAAAPEGR